MDGFTPDSQDIFFTQENGFAKALNIYTGEEILSVNVNNVSGDYPNEAVLSPNGNLVAAGIGQKLIIWSALTGEKVLQIETSPIYVSIVACSPSGESVAGISVLGKPRIWDTLSGVEQFRVEGYSCSRIAFSKCGKQFATCSVSGITLWNTEAGSVMAVFRGNSDVINCIAFSPDGEKLVSGGLEGTVRIWDAAQRTLVDEDEKSGAWSRVVGMCFSPDSSAVYAVCNEAHGVDLVTVDVLGVAKKELKIQSSDHQSFDGLQSLSPYSQKFAVLSSFGDEFLIFDKSTATTTYPTEKPTHEPGSCKFSPDGSFMVKIEDNGDIKIFDTLTGETKKTLNLGPFSKEAHWYAKSSLAISTNSRVISIVSPQSVHIWDIDSGTIEDFTPHGIQFDFVLAVSSCGRKIVAWCENDASVGVWDLMAGTQVQELPVVSWVDIRNGLFTPDDKYLWTKRGFLSLNPDSGTSNLRQDDPNLCLFVDNDWINRDGEPILWLPPDYRPTEQAVSDDTVVLICDGNWMSIQFCNEF